MNLEMSTIIMYLTIRNKRNLHFEVLLYITAGTQWGTTKLTQSRYGYYEILEYSYIIFVASNKQGGFPFAGLLYDGVTNFKVLY